MSLARPVHDAVEQPRSQLAVHVSKDLHRALKVAAIEANVTLTTLIGRYLVAGLKRDA